MGDNNEEIGKEIIRQLSIILGFFSLYRCLFLRSPSIRICITYFITPWQASILGVSHAALQAKFYAPMLIHKSW